MHKVSSSKMKDTMPKAWLISCRTVNLKSIRKAWNEEREFDASSILSLRSSFIEFIIISLYKKVIYEYLSLWLDPSLLQIWYRMERCEICSDLGVPQGWIRTNSKVRKPRFQVEVCGGTVLLHIPNISKESLDSKLIHSFFTCSITFVSSKRFSRTGNRPFSSGWLSS